MISEGSQRDSNASAIELSVAVLSLERVVRAGIILAFREALGLSAAQSSPCIRCAIMGP